MWRATICSGRNTSHRSALVISPTPTPNGLVLYWQAGSKEIQSLIKQERDAESQLAAFKSREGIDYVEVVDLDTGKNSIRVSDMVASSDQLGLADDNNRVLVYGSNGGQIGTFWVAAPKYLAPPTCSLLAARTATLRPADAAAPCREQLRQSRRLQHFQRRRQAPAGPLCQPDHLPARHRRTLTVLSKRMVQVPPWPHQC